MSVFRVGSNKSSVNNFPSVRPTLDLDFANSKTLDSRITFTRASGGSYVGADGLIKYAGVNEARFDHDPYTGESLGLLVEESRSNLITYSEDFSNAAWVKQNTHPFTSNSVVAPDGTLTADTLYRTVNNQFISQSVTGTGTYTLSAWVRSQNATGSFVMQPYNPIDGIPGVQTFTATNVWKRFSITTTITANSAWYPCIPLNINENFYVWGAQLEQGAFPTSYIPTQASTRTRSADDASITGKNFSEWYRQDEGTFFIKSPNASGIPFWSTQRVLDVYGPRFQLGTAGDFAMLNDAGAVPFQMGSSPSYPKRIASAYKLGDYAQSNEGRLVTSASNTICTGQAVLQIGELVNQYLNGTISQLTYYPKRLPNAQLQALTK
jgi:hypothetical protein